MFPSAILTSLMSTGDAGEMPQVSMNAGLSEEGMQQNHPFISIMNSMGLTENAEISEQELAALMDAFTEQIGENLPQEIELETGVPPEALTGEALLSYLMANSGGKLDSTAGSGALFNIELDIDGEAEFSEELETSAYLDTELSKQNDMPETEFVLNTESTSEKDVLSEPVLSETVLTEVAGLAKNIENPEEVGVVNPNNESKASIEILQNLMSNSELNVQNESESSEFIETVSIVEGEADSSKEGPISLATDDTTEASFFTLVDPKQAVKIGQLDERTPTEGEIKTALSILKDEKLSAEPKPNVISQTVEESDADLKTVTSPLDSAIGTKSKPGDESLTVDTPKIIKTDQPSQTVLNNDRLADLERPVSSLADINIGGTSSASKSISEQVMSLQMTELQRPMKLSEAGQALVNRIQMMAAGEIKQATIRLDPPELGSLEVKVKVQQEQTQIQIVTQSHQVKEALESQSVRLREALAEQGLNLSNLDVSDQQTQNQGEHQGGSGTGVGGDGIEDAIDIESVDVMTPIGLVDQYV